ncbi:diguanylate cyclase/phosphodiesterase with PAS/PAC sensor(s) [Rhodopseudomonas palustris HaA2]|uniref:Diguanylate cyclase/phosphodiesterase with PAS/PAC sensor(S) n=1 Tax=Rhodopseudomonas palustris (strain HaA2) TaxID=316058 RepID=Q2IV34_RHOP2|nr:EAL domain-containing protein [Rhodopseudomonas palustris]ABD07926.1 diguanylate cyclase/phosphodiesterase with PAS/PAC sensor(s) [Rhodopseudomonas palustris HaA2]
MEVGDSLSADDRDVRLAALERTRDAVVIVDHDGHLRYVNAAAESTFGLDRTGLLGRAVGALGHDELGARIVQAAFAAVDPDRPLGQAGFEITIGRQDRRAVRAAVSVSRAQVGSGDYAIAFVRDITQEVEQREGIAALMTVAERASRAVLVTDRDDIIIYTNPSFTRLFGYSAEETKGRHAGELLAGRHSNRRTIASPAPDIDDEGSEQQILLYAKDGGEIWVSAEVKGLRDGRGVALLTDISESVQLRTLQQLTLSALADEIPITELADRMCRFVEKIAPDVVSSLQQIESGLVRPLGGPGLPDEYSRALDGVAIGPEKGSCGTAAYFGNPVLAIDIDTDPRWQPFKALPLAAGLRACWSSPIKAKDGRVIGTFAFYFRECRAPSRWHERIVDACVHLGALAIERKEARAQIARLAYYDMLTGLPNRARLRDLIAQATGTCPPGQHVALAFLDVDNFKDVNDTLGHAAGDDFLVAFAQRLREQIRPCDMLARLGGDEFVIVMPGRNASEAGLVASRIAEALALPLGIGTWQVPMSASIGISLYPDNATDIDVLIRQADTAMYQAKRSGRSTYRFFSEDMNGAAEERMAYSAALRNAITFDLLELHYQPQIGTRDGAIHGVEALARWNDPVLGAVSPAKFIPLAEECGLIEQVALWSIRAACRQMAAWRALGLDIPCVSVNLSPINFQNPNLADLVSDILAELRLPPEVLMLEVTEGVIQNERSLAIETMNALRRLGVGLSLDDFGTGYSSLSQLAQLPIRELKIDRGFMRDIAHQSSARAVVTAVVRVGQSLQLSVIAEGVETDEQFALLAELGCDAVQGFLYAPALTPAAFELWLVDYSARRGAAMSKRVAGAPIPALPELRAAAMRRLG